jgi:UDP-glucose 4-epimerase
MENRLGADHRSRVLVTGGSGFIGRRLVTALLAGGADVTVADRHEPSAPGVRFVDGDLRDPAVASQAVSPGTEVIVHLAAVTSVLRSVEDPAGTYEANVAATAGLLELARTRDVGTFLLASTNAVVGDVGAAVITEQMPLRPLTRTARRRRPRRCCSAPTRRRTGRPDARCGSPTSTGPA